MTEPASYPRRRDVRGGEGRGPQASPARETGRPPSLPHQRGSAPSDLALIHAGDDPRGRHASGRGDGFGRLVVWTVLGALLPGAGLVAAGRRAWGWLVLVPFLFTAGLLAAVVATGRAVPLARRVVFEPRAMLALALVAALVALVWSVVIVAGHLALRRERPSRAQAWLSLLLITALVALVVMPAGTAARYALANRSLLLGVFGDGGSGASPDTNAADPWAKVDRVNILLLGADTGADREGTRPDTIMVASIDTKSGDSVLFNLPRQLEDVPFPPGTAAARAWPKDCKDNGANGCMLNAVYLFGTEHPQLFPGAVDPGIEATRQAVATALGLQVDYQATVDLEGFQSIVDAMGGLRLDVHRRIPIGGGKDLLTGRKYPITGWIEKGDGQLLDGYHALWFARSREGSDNNDRMARQQCVISAAVEQYDVLALAKAFPSLAAAATKDVQTDISADQLNAFVDLGARVKDGSMRSLTITSANTDTGDPDYPALRAMVAQALVPPTAPAPAASASAPASGSASGSAPAPAASAPASADEAVDASSVC